MTGLIVPKKGTYGPKDLEGLELAIEQISPFICTSETHRCGTFRFDLSVSARCDVTYVSYLCIQFRQEHNACSHHRFDER